MLVLPAPVALAVPLLLASPAEVVFNSFQLVAATGRLKCAAAMNFVMLNSSLSLSVLGGAMEAKDAGTAKLAGCVNNARTYVCSPVPAGGAGVTYGAMLLEFWGFES